MPLHRHGHVHGTSYSEQDVIVFLESAGVADPDAALDDPQRVQWHDSPARMFSASGVLRGRGRSVTLSG